MFAILSTIVLMYLAPATNAAVGPDLNCTTYNGTAFVYTAASGICSNLISDAACNVLYPPDTLGAVAAGNDNPRPLTCYTRGTVPGPIDTGLKSAAIANCPRTCGYCCQTNGYSCPNVAFPRLNCNTITAAQCVSAAWRTIIATDCPSACGLCNTGGCVDAVVECANDITICGAVGLQTFVNTNCQRTCNRCTSTTVASTALTCSVYNADSTTTCAAWAVNGFCTNTFYTLAQRKAYCARTCRIC